MINDKGSEVGGKPCLENLFEDLNHPNPNINKKAYLKMVQYWPKESIPRLLENLDHSDMRLRRTSIKALGSFGDTILLPMAKILHSSNNKTLKTSCLKVLVQVASGGCGRDFPDEVLETIEQAIEDDTPEIILTVIPLLKLIGEKGYGLLFKACNDKNILRSYAAIMTLVEIDSPDVREFLKDLYEKDSTDEFIKGRIYDALITDFI